MQLNLVMKILYQLLKQLKNLAKKAGKPKWEIEEIDHSEFKKKIAKTFEKDLRKAFKETDKKKINSYFRNRHKCKEMFAEDDER